ncbi:MAG: coproporphyrinogen III oxidase family protein [Alphaproteobacteria bacterium]|nr:coproporphyrinogen III oxidase family protein [Alphaproteobacteria bacterium]
MNTPSRGPDPRAPDPRDEARRLLREGQHTVPPYAYTYPPKRAFSPMPDLDGVEAWAGYAGPLNVYVHVPFCEMKCRFCNLFTVQGYSADFIERYVAALLQELHTVASVLGEVRLASVHFGGGTPALLSEAQLRGLLDALTGRFPVEDGAELAIEGTPESLTRDKLRALRAAGFNRVSLGIQSLDAAGLEGMGRRAGQPALTALDEALAQGFPNVNADLIYGLPQQRREDFLGDLAQVIAAGPPTVTLYPIVLRERTSFGLAARRGAETFTTDAELYTWHDDAVRTLEAAGYEALTLVLHARPGGGNGFEVQEFLGVPTLGLGAGARSYAPTLHYTSDDYFAPTRPMALTQAWLEGVEAGRVPVRCGARLDPEDQLRRQVILQLLYQGVPAALQARFPVEFEALQEQGWLREGSDTIRLNRVGLRYSSLIARLFHRPGVELADSGYR